MAVLSFVHIVNILASFMLPHNIFDNNNSHATVCQPTPLMRQADTHADVRISSLCLNPLLKLLYAFFHNMRMTQATSAISFSVLFI